MLFAAGLSKLCSLDEIRLSANSSELSVAIDSRNVLFPACCNSVSSYHWRFICHILCRDFVRIQKSEVSMTLVASSPQMIWFLPVGPTNLACCIDGWERFLRAAEVQNRLSPFQKLLKISAEKYIWTGDSNRTAATWSELKVFLHQF